MTPRLAASLLFTACLPAQALDIQLNAAPGMDANALAGFQIAASYWEARLMDSVQVNIDVDFAALSPGVLGQAGSDQVVVPVSTFFSALGADSTTSYDALALGNLPGLSGLGGLSFRTQANTEGSSLIVSLDNDDSNNNRYLALNTANAKALGLYSSTSPDASITFSSGFLWDFDSGDGVGAGLQDFVGVAIHEIGHALGFLSGIDTVEMAIDGVPGADSPFDLPFDLDEYAVFSSLDMFRYSSAGVLDLAVGENSYFSLDGGLTNLGFFSTGTTYGDGNQASHWKDNLALGIMDPTANPAGQANTPSTLDKIALDAIGWDMNYAVPEPSSLLMLALGSLMLGRRRR